MDRQAEDIDLNTCHDSKRILICYKRDFRQCPLNFNEIAVSAQERVSKVA
jgi:hypothetical protein